MKVPLYPEIFDLSERLVVKAGAISAHAFRYPSGVEALRVKSDRLELVILPFMGQQIWRAVADGRDLTMQTVFDHPRQTAAYLETYGAFFIHCGLAGIGAPGPDDTHPLHGELPLARYNTAWIEVDRDSLSVRGSFHHTVAFGANYYARPVISVAPGRATFDVSMTIENARTATLEVMYLAHANFRAVDDGELIYAAHYDADAVRVRQAIPSHISPPPGYADFIAELAVDPVRHHRLSAQLAFDPEVVFAIDMLADEDGWTHAMQCHPDGSADWISYRPAQAPLCNRWICRTADTQGLGLAFPSTSGVEGYNTEKSRGAYHALAGNETWRVDTRMGALDRDDAAHMSRAIHSIAGRQPDGIG